MDSNIEPNNKKQLAEPSFCLVIPMFNEENNVEECVQVLANFLQNLKNRCELLIVDDGSDDKTSTILNKLNLIYENLTIKSHQYNQGYGAANSTGVKYALSEKYKYVLFMDADLTQDPKYIYEFIKHMNRNIDFIKATRYASGGGTSGVNFLRRLISIGGNFIARIFIRIPITDYTNGFRAIKTKLFINVTFEEKNFAYLLEEINKI